MPRRPIHPRPTEPELRAAWQARRRPGWPDTFEATMDDPILATVVGLHARSLQHRAAGPVPAITVPRHRLPELRPAPAIDRKRLAAGERETLED